MYTCVFFFFFAFLLLRVTRGVFPLFSLFVSVYLFEDRIVLFLDYGFEHKREWNKK